MAVLGDVWELINPSRLLFHTSPEGCAHGLLDVHTQVNIVNFAEPQFPLVHNQGNIGERGIYAI